MLGGWSLAGMHVWNGSNWARKADVGQNKRSSSASGQQFYQSDSLRTSIVRDLATTVISK
jgi:hypothetical protein